jgi:hypothetical protein
VPRRASSGIEELSWLSVPEEDRQWRVAAVLLEPA